MQATTRQDRVRERELEITSLVRPAKSTGVHR